MRTKTCFKCGKELPLEEFYKHPQMADGHLNKCKECTKKDVKRDYDRKSSDEAWREKERSRGREKFKRLGYKYKTNRTAELCPETKCVSTKLRRKGFYIEGKEAHHWNYNEPFSVFLLSRSAHKKLHQHIVVNYDDKYCYTEDGKRLESQEEATEYFLNVLNKLGIHENLDVINF